MLGRSVRTILIGSGESWEEVNNVFDWDRVLVMSQFAPRQTWSAGSAMLISEGAEAVNTPAEFERFVGGKSVSGRLRGDQQISMF